MKMVKNIMKQKRKMQNSYVGWLIKMFVILLFISEGNVVFGQNGTTNVVKIGFYGTEKEIEKTKSILKKSSIKMFLGQEEVNVDFVSDNSFKVNGFTKSQDSILLSQKFVLFKIRKRKNRCYYFLLPNGFLNGLISSLIIYKSYISKKVFALRRFMINIKGKYLSYNFSYHSEKGFVSTPLTLIPCSKYKGEYDKGLEEYLKLKKEKLHQSSD